MWDTARSRGVVNVVGHEFPRQPQMLAIAEDIRTGGIGTPTLVTHIKLSEGLAVHWRPHSTGLESSGSLSSGVATTPRTQGAVVGAMCVVQSSIDAIGSRINLLRVRGSQGSLA